MRLRGRLRVAFNWVPVVAHHRAASIVLVATVAFGGCVLLAVRAGVPEPAIPDEFSYLLAADTFLHGRLSNPTPPASEHFETPHVLMHPTYVSKYPPGQGLSLALGRLLGHKPIFGVWLGIALACGAIVWMLQAWVPARWALVGGLVAVSRLVFLGEDARWSQSYWGGGIAAFGGALLFGALRRVWDHGRTRDAAILGIGLLLLANSRPFEGLVVSSTAMGTVAVWLQRRPKTERIRVLMPLALVIAVGAAAMALYNARITGSAWRMPYTEYESQYAIAPSFLWQKIHPVPAYATNQLARLYIGVFLRHFNDLHTFHGYMSEMSDRVASLAGFFVGLPLMACAGGAWALVRDRWTTLATATIGLLLASMFSISWYHTHYAAPASCLIVLLVVQSLRRVRAWRVRELRLGKAVLQATAIVCLVATIHLAWGRQLYDDWTQRRAEIARSLETQGGRHLVLVHSRPYSSVNAEWVYNGADMNDAPVIWARDLGPSENQDLLDAFRDRTVWVLDIDRKRPELVPYDVGQTSAQGATPRWGVTR